MQTSPSASTFFRATIILGAALAGCGGKPPPPPPSEVRYVTVRRQAISLSTDLPGRTAAHRIAEIRPQVGGVIQKRLFVEGNDVAFAQQLYQIDPAPFQANLASAQASLQKAQASVVSASALAERYKALTEARAVSRQDLDNAVSSKAQAEADVASAKASVDTARINLKYTHVLSPIAGRTGRSTVTEGALVGANQTTAIVVVQQLDPIYVDVTQSSTQLLRLRNELKTGRLTKDYGNAAEVTLVLEDGSVYPQKGHLKFTEVTVDQGTGSVTLRAEFPNPDGTLLPGMFVHEQIEEGVNPNALLVPQQGISHNGRGEPTALVLNADGKTEIRMLKTDRAIGDQWLVSEGLQVGDKVIVEGQQSLKPDGIPVAKEISIADLRSAGDAGTPAKASPAASAAH